MKGRKIEYMWRSRTGVEDLLTVNEKRFRDIYSWLYYLPRWDAETVERLLTVRAAAKVGFPQEAFPLPKHLTEAQLEQVCKYRRGARIQHIKDGNIRVVIQCDTFNLRVKATSKSRLYWISFKTLDDDYVVLPSELIQELQAS